MKTLVRLLPAALALLLLAAHFVRAGRAPLAASLLVLVAVLFVPRLWAVRTVQGLLAVGVGVWLHTAWSFAAERRAMGAPSARLWAILGAVAAFTALAAWMLEGRARALRGVEAERARQD